METQISKEIAIRGKFYLPDDVMLTPVSSLSQEVRSTLQVESPEDIAITRRFTRSSTKIVDADLASLLSEFSEGSTIPFAIARYCKNTEDNPQEMLIEALPILMDMISSSILTAEEEEGTLKTDFSYKLGDSVSNFKIVDQIQVFSESEVYKVSDNNGKEYALKLGRNTQGDFTEFLENECNIHIKLGNTNTENDSACKGTHEGNFWIASKWYNGMNIGQIASTYRSCDARDKLLMLVKNILQAYQEIHQKNILHGDVHTGNLLMERNGEISIIDFGNGRDLSESSDKNKGKRGGIAYFFEPEYASAILKGDPPPAVTKKSEQFSIASLLYFLITGHYYEDFDLERKEMFTMISSPNPKPFEYYKQDAWPEVEEVLHKALSRNPKNRFENLQDMIDALPSEAVDADIEKFILQFANTMLSSLSPEVKQFNEGLHTGPICSLNGGAGGVAYAFLRMAYGLEDSELLAQSELWLNKAISDQDERDAFANPKHEEQSGIVGSLSIHHTEIGLTFISCLISSIKREKSLTEANLEKFLNEISTECDKNDVTLGKLSVVLAISELLQHLDIEFEPLIKKLTHRGDSLMSEVWNANSFKEPIGSDFTEFNFGFAHGWAGVLYTRLLWSEITGSKLPDDFINRCDQLSAKLYSHNRGQNIHWMDAKGVSMGSMSGWCNGSSGLIYLYALLNEKFGGQEYQKILEDLAWNVWDGHSSGIDICCGSAGRVFALLRASEVLTDRTSWLERAKVLAKIGILTGQHLDSEEHPMYSLFKGQLGLALSGLAVLNRGSLTMPMMGIT